MKSYAEQLKPYQNFESTTEFKEAFNAYRRLHRYELTKSDNEILFIMAGFAVKFPGACKIKLETISKVSGLSLSTVKRAISKAVKLGIMQRFKTRKDGGTKQGVTVYQFQKIKDEQHDEPQEMDHRQDTENPCESKVEAVKNEGESLSFEKPLLSFKDTYITDKHGENNSVDKELFKKNALLDKIPNSLRGLSVYFDKAQDIYNMVGVIFRAKNKVSKSIKIEEHPGLFSKTIAAVYEYWKRQVQAGNVDYNVFGLMYKAIKELAEKIINGTAYQVQQSNTKAPNHKFENAPDWFEFDKTLFDNRELVPNWMNEREQFAPVENTNEHIDFEKEQKKFLERLYG